MFSKQKHAVKIASRWLNLSAHASFIFTFYFLLFSSEFFRVLPWIPWPLCGSRPSAHFSPFSVHPATIQKQAVLE
jgi:hypothetical protein